VELALSPLDGDRLMFRGQGKKGVEGGAKLVMPGIRGRVTGWWSRGFSLCVVLATASSGGRKLVSGTIPRTFAENLLLGSAQVRYAASASGIGRE
jgi:hypothetical protein